jgi:hypothetical protein
MSLFVYENVVWFDVTETEVNVEAYNWKLPISPMDKPQFMNGFDCQNTLRHIKPCYIFGKGVVLDQHCLRRRRESASVLWQMRD